MGIALEDTVHRQLPGFFMLLVVQTFLAAAIALAVAPTRKALTVPRKEYRVEEDRHPRSTGDSSRVDDKDSSHLISQLQLR